MSRRGSYQTASDCTQSTACAWWRTCVRFSPAPAPLPLHATSSCWGKVTPPSHPAVKPCCHTDNTFDLSPPQTQSDYKQSVPLCGGSSNITAYYKKTVTWSFPIIHVKENIDHFFTTTEASQILNHDQPTWRLRLPSSSSSLIFLYAVDGCVSLIKKQTDRIVTQQAGRVVSLSSCINNSAYN